MKVIKHISMKLTKAHLKEIIMEYLGEEVESDFDIRFSLGDPREGKDDSCIVVEYSIEDGI